MIRLSLYLCVISLVTSCGGGSGDVGQTNTISDVEQSTTISDVEQPTNLEFESDYFELVENAFDVMFDGITTPEGGGPGYPGVMKIFDRNGDGYDDILYIASSFRWEYTGDGQSYSVMNYWENSGAGSFVNKTVELFGTESLDVAVRKVRFFDINSDGVLDILLTSNREDGRRAIGNPTTNMEASNVTYISKPDGSYETFMVGVPAWTHHAEIFDIDYDGVLEVIDGNYTNRPTIYDLMPDGTWSDTSSEHQTDIRDVFNANDMALADFSGDNCVDSISNSPDPDSAGKGYYIGDCLGGFTLEESYPITSDFSTMPGQSWNGDLSNFMVADIDGQLVAGLANYWSHAADFDNDGDMDLLFATETTKITEEEIENNLYIEGGEKLTHLTLLKNNAGTLEKVTALSGGLTNIGLYWARLVDVNADSYLDLIVDDHNGWDNSANFNDVIFLNKGDGTFVKNSATLISGEIPNSLKSSVPIDFNNDGIMDFIIRKPCTANCLSESISLLKGTQHLPTP